MGEAQRKADECSADTDCPGALVCYSAALSWTEGVGRCDCMGWYGKWGLACDEPAAYFYVSVGVIVLVVLIALALAAMSFRDALRVSKHLRGLTRSSSNATPAFTTASLFSFAAWKLSYLLEFLLPLDAEGALVTPQDLKIRLLADSTAVVMVFLMTSTTLGLLNLSLMWLEVSRKAMHMTRETHRKMNIYRTICIVVGVLMVVSAFSLVVTHLAYMAVAICMPVSMALAALFVAGRRGMDRVLADVEHEAGNNPTRLEKRLVKTAASIRRCCNRTVVGILAFAGSAMLWFWIIVLDPNGGLREHSRPGVGCWPQLTYELVSITVLVVLYTQFVYSREDIDARLNHVSSTLQSSIAAMDDNTATRTRPN